MRILAVPYGRRAAPEGSGQLRRSVACTYSGYVLDISIVIPTGRATADGGPRRTTARHDGQADAHATVYYDMK